MDQLPRGGWQTPVGVDGGQEGRRRKSFFQKRNGSREHNLPVIPKAERLTFNDAAQAVSTTSRPTAKHRSPSCERRITKHLRPISAGGGWPGSPSADVTAFIAKRQADTIVTRKAHHRPMAPRSRAVTKPVSNAEINRELQTFKRMFSLAMQADASR